MTDIVFVAGATGYTGREVVRLLAARSVPVWAHVRPDSTRLQAWTERFADWGAGVDTTAWDEEAMAETLERLGVTVVYALLGTTRERARHDPTATYEAVDYGLTALLLRAAGRCSTPPRFVYLSSLGVSDETRNAYLEARARIERELRASGLAWVIARPSFITGDDREESRPGERVAARVSDVGLGVLGLLGATRLRDRYASLTGTELASGLVHHGLSPQSVGRVVSTEELRVGTGKG